MEVERARWEKKKARIARDTGKVFKTVKFRPVTTPAMAKKAAEGLARGLSPTQALREAGYPPATLRWILWPTMKLKRFDDDQGHVILTS